MTNDDELVKLKAELAFYKGFHDGVCKTGTHVVVPVEPTEAMKAAGWDHQLYGGDETTIYRAMIKAAQESDNG